jgi:hypothetical protein
MRTSKTRYQHLGDHLKSVLDNVTVLVDKYITDSVIPVLPQLHGEDGICSEIDTTKPGCDNDSNCIVLHHKVCNCIKHRRKHLEVWSKFITSVVQEIIPRAVNIQHEEIDRLKLRAGESYKAVLHDIVNSFGDVIKKSFISLQNVEIKNHQVPLETLSEYRRELNKIKNIGNTKQDCIRMLSKEHFPSLKEHARSLDIRLTDQNKKTKTTLSTAICNVLLDECNV